MSRHDIAGIWVAFFQECQQYRCGQEACEPFHLQLLPNPNFAQTDLASLVLGADIAYVYGGNTKSMLAVWKEPELMQNV